MEKQKLVEFDFKKIIPVENSEVERKISRIVTKKFLMLSFVIAFGFGLSTHMIDSFRESSQQQEKLENERATVTQRANYVIAKENKDLIVANLEQQLSMYDDIIKDVFETNQQVPNSAQTILAQNTQIRQLSQDYKETIAKTINNFNMLITSEDSLKRANEDDKKLFFETVKNYQIGSLNRNNDLEKLLMSYTTVENDEKEVTQKAQPIRQELKSKIVPKMSNLLASNEITQYKKIKIK